MQLMTPVSARTAGTKSPPPATRVQALVGIVEAFGPIEIRQVRRLSHRPREKDGEVIARPQGEHIGLAPLGIGEAPGVDPRANQIAHATEKRANVFGHGVPLVLSGRGARSLPPSRPHGKGLRRFS
jgi:hypothetical protein